MLDAPFNVMVVFVPIISLTSSQNFEGKWNKNGNERGKLANGTMISFPPFTFKSYFVYRLNVRVLPIIAKLRSF